MVLLVCLNVFLVCLRLRLPPSRIDINSLSILLRDKNSEGLTRFMYAVEGKNLEVVQYLLEEAYTEVNPDKKATFVQGLLGTVNKFWKLPSDAGCLSRGC